MTWWPATKHFFAIPFIMSYFTFKTTIHVPIPIHPFVWFNVWKLIFVMKIAEKLLTRLLNHYKNTNKRRRKKIIITPPSSEKCPMLYGSPISNKMWHGRSSVFFSILECCIVYIHTILMYFSILKQSQLSFNLCNT